MLGGLSSRLGALQVHCRRLERIAGLGELWEVRGHCGTLLVVGGTMGAWRFFGRLRDTVGGTGAMWELQAL